MSDPTTNGEALFFNNFVKHNAKVIFDVGCKENSIFTEFEGEVHYFNPMRKVLTKLSKMKNKNSRSVFNRVGLLNTDGDVDFYPEYNSFVDHYKSLDTFPSEQCIRLPCRKGEHYMRDQGLPKIDMLKISANGCEFEVIKGFENVLQNVHILQFEYGPHYYDSDVKLNQVIDYLHKKGYYNFSYLTPTSLVDVTDLTDFYECRHIVCLNQHFERS